MAVSSFKTSGLIGQNKRSRTGFCFLKSWRKCRYMLSLLFGRNVLRFRWIRHGGAGCLSARGYHTVTAQHGYLLYVMEMPIGPDNSIRPEIQ